MNPQVPHFWFTLRKWQFQKMIGAGTAIRQ
jgi:hypothetical protein